MRSCNFATDAWTIEQTIAHAGGNYAKVRVVTVGFNGAQYLESGRIAAFTGFWPDDGTQVHLTPIEWQLLEALVRHPGKLVGQRQLLQQVWGPTYQNETDYVRQYMKHLRRKLEDDPTRPRHLITEPGMGYRFQP